MRSGKRISWRVARRDGSETSRSGACSTPDQVMSERLARGLQQGTLFSAHDVPAGRVNRLLAACAETLLNHDCEAASVAVTETVLVIDDMPPFLDMMREVLEEQGYRVVTCLQARDALRLVQEQRPDVVVLDLGLPEVSGWEILAELRGRAEFAQLPVIICSAWLADVFSRLGGAEGSQAYGPVGVLPKPFDVDELLEVLASLRGALTPNSGASQPVLPSL